MRYSRTGDFFACSNCEEGSRFLWLKKAFPDSARQGNFAKKSKSSLIFEVLQPFLSLYGKAYVERVKKLDDVAAAAEYEHFDVGMLF